MGGKHCRNNLELPKPTSHTIHYDKREFQEQYCASDLAMATALWVTRANTLPTHSFNDHCNTTKHAASMQVTD